MQRFFFDEEGINRLNTFLLHRLPTIYGNELGKLLKEIVKEETVSTEETKKEKK